MPDVLVADDKRAEGEEFAKYIASKTGLATHFTDDLDEATRVVREEHVKVAVLDQRLEGRAKNGTDLFRDLREIEPQLRGILFSAQSSSADLAAALEQGFVNFLDK